MNAHSSDLNQTPVVWNVHLSINQLVEPKLKFLNETDGIETLEPGFDGHPWS